MARGRRTGYSNYSVREQLLLCAIVEKIVPIGRNEWERITIHYNSRRGRSSLERDLKSLRRKFKTLYNKPKPSGNREVKPAYKAILWAKRIQMEIEEKAGSHTTFDGADEDEGSGNRGNFGSNNGAETGTGASGSLPGSTIYTLPSSNTGAMPDPDGAGVRRYSSNDGDPGSSIAGHARPSFSPRMDSSFLGVAVTSSGTFDATLAAALDLSDSDEALDEEDNGVAYEDEVNDEEVINGATLFRDSNRAVADAREKARNPRLSSVSNRLGGHDLGVVRDSMRELSKRSTLTDDLGFDTFTQAKRYKTAKRIDSICQQINNIEAKHTTSGASDITSLLVFYREESDRKAETDEQRRREDRAARDEAQKRDREERERARQEELDRLREERAVRLEQSEKWQNDKEERRRPFDARMELERAEARERHSEMMMLLAKLISK
ncbi:hypothetical protein PInf_004391 [Phytophthora infestans]|nr:hypothetical protein PInf_004391 [Phytophthora infestans]